MPLAYHSNIYYVYAIFNTEHRNYRIAFLAISILINVSIILTYFTTLRFEIFV